MAIVSTAITVASTATLMASGDADGDELVVKNADAVDIFVGGADVSTSNGFAIEAGAALSFKLPAGVKAYGIVATGTADARVLKVQP